MRRKSTWLSVTVAAAVGAVAVLVAPSRSPDSAAPADESVPIRLTTATPPRPPVERQPGPRSALADVELPADSDFVGASSNQEVWRYRASYDDTVAFLRRQFAAGRTYDARGATWWRDLPPCYNDKSDTTGHESPPQGWVDEDSTRWLWADGGVSLSVEAFGPSSSIAPNDIVIEYTSLDHDYVCNRD